MMNNLVNKVNLIGHLGAAPEITTLESGRILARFSIAVNWRQQDKEGNWITQTQWHNIKAWGKTAERTQKLLEKGHKVMVEGRLINRAYEKNGEKIFFTDIEMNDFLVLSMNKKD